MQKEDCIFCKIVKKEIPAEIIYEDNNFLSFMDIMPLQPGHLMIIPKEHVNYVFDLEAPIYSGIFETAKKLSPALEKATNPKRVGISVEGLAIDHVHLHLIPINNPGDMDSTNAKKGNPEELAKMAALIRSHIL